MLIEATAHVIVERDGWDWLVIGVTILALVAAFAAIWISIGARRDVDRDIRNTFELGVLKELVERWHLEANANSPQLKALARLIPTSELPRLDEFLHHQRVKEPTSGLIRDQRAHAKAALARMEYINPLLNAIEPEMLAAIERRVTVRKAGRLAHLKSAVGLGRSASS